MVTNKISKLAIIVLALFTILIASCGSASDDVETSEIIKIDNDNSEVKNTETNNQETTTNNEADETFEDEFVEDDSEEEVEIGELY